MVTTVITVAWQFIIVLKLKKKLKFCAILPNRRGLYFIFLCSTIKHHFWSKIKGKIFFRFWIDPNKSVKIINYSMLFENPAVAAKLPFPYNVPPPMQAAAALPMPNLRWVAFILVLPHFLSEYIPKMQTIWMEYVLLMWVVEGR